MNAIERFSKPRGPTMVAYEAKYVCQLCKRRVTEKDADPPITYTQEETETILSMLKREGTNMFIFHKCSDVIGGKGIAVFLGFIPTSSKG